MMDMAHISGLVAAEEAAQVRHEAPSVVLCSAVPIAARCGGVQPSPLASCWPLFHWFFSLPLPHAPSPQSPLSNPFLT